MLSLPHVGVTEGPSSHDHYNVTLSRRSVRVAGSGEREKAAPYFPKGFTPDERVRGE